MAEPAPELALAAICRDLVRLGRRFALVGGLAVSVRAEVRFTRDVDIAVIVADDLEAESLTYELRLAGYTAVASVEHETCHRLSTVRLMSPSGVKVDLLFASSGIEMEIVDSATPMITPQRKLESLWGEGRPKDPIADPSWEAKPGDDRYYLAFLDVGKFCLSADALCASAMQRALMRVELAELRYSIQQFATTSSPRWPSGTTSDTEVLGAIATGLR